MGKLLATAGLVCLAFWFSYSSVDYARYLQTGEDLQPASRNLLFSDRAHSIAVLDRELAALELAKEFMVWPQEEQEIVARLRTLLREKQNLVPSDRRSALAYLAFQQGQPAAQNEVVWTLHRAIRLNQWQVSQRPALAYHCLDREQVLTQSLKEQCQIIFTNLPKNHHPERLRNQLRADRELIGLDVETGLIRQ